MNEDTGFNPETEPDLVTVSDDNGEEYVFQILDRIETDDARYVALTETYDTEEEMLESEGELIFLKVEEAEDGDTYLCPIDNKEEYTRIGDIFEERLSQTYEIRDDDDTDDSGAVEEDTEDVKEEPEENS